MTDRAHNFNEAVQLIVKDSDILSKVVNGTSLETVAIEDGTEIPTLRKTLIDNFKFKDPIDWAQGESESEFLQIRRFTDGTMWYAPNARKDLPIPMGVTPVGDTNWVIAITSADLVSLQLKTLAKQFGLFYKGVYVVGAVFDKFNDVYVFNDNFYGVVPTVTLPYTAAESDPEDDPNLMLRGGASKLFVKNTVYEVSPMPWKEGDIAVVNRNYLFGKIVLSTDKSNEVMGVKPDFEIFKTKKPILSDFISSFGDSAISEMVKNGGELYIDVIQDISSNIDLAVDNIFMHGSGGFNFANSVVGVCFKITGDNNKIKRLNITHDGDMTAPTNIAVLVGNKNRFEKCSASFSNDPSVFSGGMYNGVAFKITGDSSSIVDCNAEKVSTVAENDGRDNYIKGNTSKSCLRLVYNTAKARNHLVVHNSCDCNNYGNGSSGADGLTDNRSARFGNFYSNTIKGIANNGAYLQGDGFVLDKSNWFEDCGRAFVKVGAKPSNNFEYAGETLPKFDQNGNPDPSGQYATTNAIIEVRGKNGNVNSNSDGLITLQSNIAGLTIKDYSIKDSTNSLRAIQGVYLESEPAENQHVMANIKILEGEINDAGNVVIACKAGLVIDGIDCDCGIQTQARTGEICVSPKINVLKADYIDLTKSQYAQVLGGVVRYVNKSNALNARIYDTTMTEQSAGGDFSGGRVEAIRRCLIRWGGTVSLNIDGVQFFQMNEVSIPDFNTSYALTYNFNSSTPENGQFSDNTISVPKSSRPARIGGSVSSICGNNIQGSGSDDYTLTVQSDGSTITGTTLNAGSIYLDGNSSNCFCVGKKIIDAGTNNKIIT